MAKRNIEQTYRRSNTWSRVEQS